MNRAAYLYNAGKPYREMLRARAISKSATSITGDIAVFSDKLRKKFESPLEREFLLVLDFDWDVEAFYDKPIAIPYIGDEGESCEYYPDFLVKYRKKRIPKGKRIVRLVEVVTKRTFEADRDTYERKFAAARRWVEPRGWEFAVYTEDDIRTPYLGNAEFLRGYRNRVPDRVGELLLTHALEMLGETTPDALLKKAAQLRLSDPEILNKTNADDLELRGKLLPSIWRMIVQGRVHADLSKPLTMQSPIKLG